MDPNTLNLIEGAAGAGGSDPAYWVEEVFNTTVFTANSSTGQSFVTGLDLAGEGGMVWHKDREYTIGHSIWDTERGTSSVLNSNNYDSANTFSNSITFNSDGHSVTGAQGNEYTDKTVAWSFRKAPGFFDVVTWTGNSTAGREIAHNLGSAPGMIIVKCTTHNENWVVWHQSIYNTQALWLQSTDEVYDQSAGPINIWNSTTPTSTAFTVGDFDGTNGDSSHSYVAYIFADGADAGAEIFGDGEDESIIKCGMYGGNGTSGDSEGNFQDLGWEPQWLLLKNISTSSDPYTSWHIFDNMRGVNYGHGTLAPLGYDERIFPNSNSSETSDALINFVPRGFSLTNSGYNVNQAGDDYIYVAIRRGPMKTPEDATEVFDDVAYTGTGGAHDVPISPSYADLVFYKRRDTTDNWGWTSRLTGNLAYMSSNSTNDEANRNAADALEYDKQSAFGLVGNSSGEVNYNGESYISYAFKRAPGFLDIIAYTGTGNTRALGHNLRKTPEFVIIKNRSRSGIDWTCWHKDLTAAYSNNPYIFLNDDAAEGPFGGTWIGAFGLYDFLLGSQASTTYYNESGDLYLAYLFATCPGVSKVGGYTGTGNDIDVDCGFTAGARFVMIKRTDSTGDWYVWDTERGIVSGDDPYLFINDNAVEVANTDYIDPFTTGFTVTSSAPDALNVLSGEYIYLAIA